MIQNNLSILSFVTSLDDQDYKKPFAFGDIYNMISPTSRLLPFQIVRPQTGAPVTTAVLHNLDTGASINILAELTGLQVKEFPAQNFDVILYPSTSDFPTVTLDQGHYYLELGDGASTFYSDVFTAVSDLTNFVRVEYWNDEPLEYSGGKIYYNTAELDFKYYFYAPTEIGKPDYLMEEIAEDRDGFLFVEKQISKKRHKFVFTASEYLCDALRVLRMHAYINIYDKGKAYPVDDVVVSPEWQDQGNIAAMTIEFETDTVIKNIGNPLGAGPVAPPSTIDLNGQFTVLAYPNTTTSISIVNGSGALVNLVGQIGNTVTIDAAQVTIKDSGGTVVGSSPYSIEVGVAAEIIVPDVTYDVYVNTVYDQTVTLSPYSNDDINING